eukprot:4461736-Pyramimonas_sp.AAC.1
MLLTAPRHHEGGPVEVGRLLPAHRRGTLQNFRPLCHRVKKQDSALALAEAVGAACSVTGV